MQRRKNGQWVRDISPPVAARGRGQPWNVPQLEPGKGCASADEVGQNEEGTHYMMKMPGVLILVPWCAPAAEKALPPSPAGEGIRWERFVRAKS